jgi:hypothetical protein
MDGIHDTAPNSRRVGRDCKVNTKPMMNPVTATNNKERFHVKALTKEFFKFKGRLKDSLKTDLQKKFANFE